MAGGPATWHQNQLIPLTRDGVTEDTYWTYSYSPIDNEGGVGGVLVLVTETTKQVMTEREIRGERERFAQLFEQAPTFMCVLRGPEHRFEYFNPSYLQLVGHREDLVGKSVVEAIPESVEQGYVGLLDSVYRSGEAFTANGMRIALQREPQGPREDRWLDFVYQPIKDSEGAVSGIFVEGIDVSDRMEAQLALLESKRLLEGILDAIPQQVWTARPDGQLDYINGHTKEYSGEVPIVDGIVQWATIVHPEDLQKSIPIWVHSLQTGEPYQTEQRIRHRASGAYRWNLSRALPMRNEVGTIVRWLGTNTDIEDSKITQIAMAEARDAANAANIAKTEFLANMSHEIRTPMNAIIGLSTIMAASKPLTPRQSEIVKTLSTSADSLLALINDLLDIAKIEARSVELEHIPFSMTRLIHEVVSMMAVQVKTRGLNFTVENERVRDRYFMGDPTRIRQIIINLCSNAIKFTHKGFVHVGVRCAATDNPKVETIWVEVKDSGVGIAPDKIDTIFQKFVQADSSINRKYGGTGLGLAITKTLAEIMGGTLSVESELGKGSTFTACLPLEVAPADSVPAPVLQAPVHVTSSGARPRILLVEDYEPNIFVALSFLDQFGFDADVARNGQDAFTLVKSNPYGAVLMDVQMHGTNGLDATRLIRQWEQQQGKSRLPIIGMTAHALQGDRERCLAVGMDDYVPKPFNPNELYHKIKTALEVDAV